MYKSMGKKAYSFFRSLYPFLPSVQTLNEEIKKLNICPGINPLILDYLKKKLSHLSDKQRVCVLLWDEMLIQPQVSLDKKNDTIHGKENWGSHRSTDTADHAIVFMIRGLYDGWKLPISYAFCKSATSADQLVICIKEHVRALRSVGLHVVGEFT